MKLRSHQQVGSVLGDNYGMLPPHLSSSVLLIHPPHSFHHLYWQDRTLSREELFQTGFRKLVLELESQMPIITLPHYNSYGQNIFISIRSEYFAPAGIYR